MITEILDRHGKVVLTLRGEKEPYVLADGDALRPGIYFREPLGED